MPNPSTIKIISGIKVLISPSLKQRKKKSPVKFATARMHLPYVAIPQGWSDLFAGYYFSRKQI